MRSLPLLLVLPAVLSGQGREYEFHLGRWGGGNRAVSYEFRTSQPLFGSVTHGFGVSALIKAAGGARSTAWATSSRHCGAAAPSAPTLCSPSSSGSRPIPRAKSSAPSGAPVVGWSGARSRALPWAPKPAFASRIAGRADFGGLAVRAKE